MRDLTDRAR